jgi:hypothetical protein
MTPGPQVATRSDVSESTIASLEHVVVQTMSDVAPVSPDGTP